VDGSTDATSLDRRVTQLESTGGADIPTIRRIAALRAY